MTSGLSCPSIKENKCDANSMAGIIIRDSSIAEITGNLVSNSYYQISATNVPRAQKKEIQDKNDLNGDNEISSSFCAIF